MGKSTSNWGRAHLVGAALVVNTFVPPLNGQNANGLVDSMEVWKRAGDTNQGEGHGTIWGLPKVRGAL